jgi:hypothetical protein
MPDPQSNPQAAPQSDPGDWTPVSSPNQPTATIPQGSSSQPTGDPGDWQAIKPGTPEHQSLLSRLGSGAFNLAEDVAYPLIGAAGGAALGLAAGAPTGPGAIASTIGGGVLGGMAGNELKRAVRENTGRGDLNSTGAAHVADTLSAGAGGAAQEASAAYKASGTIGKILPQVVEDAKELGINMTPGSTGGKLLSWIESHVRSNPLSSSMVNQGIDKTTNTSVLNAGKQLADNIAQVSLTKDPQALGNAIQSAGASVQKNAGVLYDQALDTIEKAGGSNVPIQLQPQVSATAQKLLGDIQSNRGDFADVFKTQQDRQLAIDTLSKFANPNVPTGRTLLGANITRPAVLPWQGAREIVSDLGALTRSGDTTLGKGALTQLKTALQDSMQTSLDAAKPGLGTMFRNASQNYAKVQDTMSNQVVEHLMDNQSPENAAKYLLSNGSSISNTQALKAAIGSRGAPLVQGSVLRELLDTSTNFSNNTLKPQTLLEKWNGLGEAAQKALFPDPQHLANVQKYMNVVDRFAQPIADQTAATNTSTAAKVSMHTIPMLIAASQAANHPVIAASTMGIVFAPQVVAKLLANAQGAQALAKAATSPAGSYAQKVAIQSAMQLAHYYSKRSDNPQSGSGATQ